MINTMFKLFRSALREDAEKEKINLDRDAWVKLFKLSKKHDLAHLIGYALKDSYNKIDEDIQKEECDFDFDEIDKVVDELKRAKRNE